MGITDQILTQQVDGQAPKPEVQASNEPHVPNVSTGAMPIAVNHESVPTEVPVVVQENAEAPASIETPVTNAAPPSHEDTRAAMDAIIKGEPDTDIAEIRSAPASVSGATFENGTVGSEQRSLNSEQRAGNIEQGTESSEHSSEVTLPTLSSEPRAPEMKSITPDVPMPEPQAPVIAPPLNQTAEQTPPASAGDAVAQAQKAPNPITRFLKLLGLGAKQGDLAKNAVVLDKAVSEQRNTTETGGSGE